MRAPSIETRTYLLTLPLFQDLAAEVVDRIADGASAVAAAPGDVLFRNGDPCTGFHAVVYGQVKLAVAAAANGAERVIDIVRSGQSFGKATMFSEPTYPMYAQAMVETLLLHISADVVRSEIVRTPALASRMLTGLSVRAIGLVSDVEAHALQSGVRRVAAYLVRRAVPVSDPQSRSRVLLDISRALIASWLNLTAEHFNRILDDLVHEGLVIVQGSEVLILDPERLEAIAFH